MTSYAGVINDVRSAFTAKNYAKVYLIVIDGVAKARGEDPGSVAEVLLLGAASAFEMNKAAKARTWLRESLKLDPAPDSSGLPPTAKAALEKAHGPALKRAEKAFEIGKERFHRLVYRTAERELKKATAAARGKEALALVFVYLGACRQGLGDAGGARALYDRAAKLSKTLVPTGAGFTNEMLALWDEARGVAKPKVVEIPVEPDGFLSVVTTPAGARVWVDEAEVGVSPVLEHKVRPGVRKVRAELAQHQASEGQVNVKPGAKREYKITLRISPAELRVETTPPGAKVTVDGVERDETPATIKGLPPGKHKLVVTLPKHKIVEREIDLAPGQSASVVLALKKGGGLDRPPVIVVEPPPPPYTETQKSKRLRGFIALGTSALLGGGAAFFLVRSGQAMNDYRASTTQADINANYDAAKLNQTLGFAFLGVTSAALVWSAIEFLALARDRRRTAKEPATKVTLLPLVAPTRAGFSLVVQR
ncbi:MAG: PEGA domain-containing protein [Deltaproteobacteria bacterium]|nr:PEGA domain-containing protein [Deltaproteobacteria bacterium]